ncbi:MAG: hypothetical protein JW774_06265 [Candidatus Aureabacteria bacterium]|nr:hypothetical protein [Candidatus Auribacterota bacterium]
MQVGAIKGNLESVKIAEQESKEMFQRAIDLKKVENGNAVSIQSAESKAEEPVAPKQSVLKTEDKGTILDLIA